MDFYSSIYPLLRMDTLELKKNVFPLGVLLKHIVLNQILNMNV